jgi:FkbM family methyltransferase
MLTVIDNHSVDLDLIRHGPILDVGCRGFALCKFFINLGRGNRVIGMDPDRGLVPPPGVEYLQLGLCGSPQEVSHLVLEQDPEARYVTFGKHEPDRPSIQVRCITLQELMVQCRVEDFDLIKLNAEGVEFDILDKMLSPAAKQIVVSFHEHTAARRGQDAVNALVHRLGKWYDIVQHVWDKRYGCGLNAWDTVLLRR